MSDAPLGDLNLQDIVEYPIYAGFDVTIPVGARHSIVSRDPASYRRLVAPYDSVTRRYVGYADGDNTAR